MPAPVGPGVASSASRVVRAAHEALSGAGNAATSLPFAQVAFGVITNVTLSGGVLSYSVNLPSGSVGPIQALAPFEGINGQTVILLYVDGEYLILGAVPDQGGGGAAPIGSVISYAGSSAPTGWLFCDGSAISRTTYALLFNAIGTTYGAGDGSTTFNLPNLSGRVALGVGNSGTAGSTAHALAGAGGEETHTLTQAEMPQHGHHAADGTSTIVQGGAGTPAGVTTGGNGYGLGDAQLNGGGGAHNTMPPFLVLNYIIKF